MYYVSTCSRSIAGCGCARSGHGFSQLGSHHGAHVEIHMLCKTGWTYMYIMYRSSVGRIWAGRTSKTPSRDVLTLIVCPDAVHLYPPAWRRRFIMFISIDWITNGASPCCATFSTLENGMARLSVLRYLIILCSCMSGLCMCCLRYYVELC